MVMEEILELMSAIDGAIALRARDEVYSSQSEKVRVTL